ncbi:hypothetical protein [Arvimicrobium flavum]|uniref:hypothetical protein n=1 Tax=Arvimicrobium flavum TaxID=3393320 RepID=UPI00237A9C45|nr:hypothetical protein [Mesorhizobium shangrilense]
MFNGLLSHFKKHLRLIAILAAVVLITRYTLFADAAEFALFSANLKAYIVPLAVGLSVLALGGTLLMALNKTSHAVQSRVSRAFFWISSAMLAVALVAAFITVKLSTATAQ